MPTVIRDGFTTRWYGDGMVGEIKYRVAFQAMVVMFLTLLSYFSVSLFYSVLKSGVTVSAISRPSPTASPARNAEQEVFPFSHYQPIIDRSLFKTQKGTAAEAAISVENLETTELDLKLWGTIVGRGADSYAVIEEPRTRSKKSEQNLFHVGDSVQGATIKKILDEQVVLRLNGKDEVLKMEEYRSGYRKRRPSRYSPTRRPITQNRVLRRSQVDSAMENLNSLMKQIRVSPHKDGIRVSRVRPRSIFRRMGIRNGDVITGIDGRRIESVDSALRLYDELRTSSKVSVQLKRRGRDRTINYTIR